LGSETVPKSFQKAIIFPIFKKGDPKVTSNYRGICFQNALAKVFSALLLERLKNWVKNNNILTEFQAGFRKGYSTVDNIFSLTSIARSYIDSGKKLYAFFVDFRAAFDSTNRRTLNYQLSNIGISTAFLNVLQSLYTDNLAAVWDGEQLSEWLTTKAGVKQGCLLSPLLFSLFLNVITDSLPCGIQICGCSIKVLLYADDIVILAKSPVELQTMINDYDD